MRGVARKRPTDDRACDTITPNGSRTDAMSEPARLGGAHENEEMQGVMTTAKETQVNETKLHMR